MPLQDLEINRLFCLAKIFRSLIVNADARLLPIQMRNFPHGSCEYASILLLKYLKENEEPNFRLMICPQIWDCGWEGHVWVQRRDITVDITLDQFECWSRPVFVGRNSVWHGRLQPVEERNPEEMGFPRQTWQEMDAAYATIIESTST